MTPTDLLAAAQRLLDETRRQDRGYLAERRRPPG